MRNIMLVLTVATVSISNISEAAPTPSPVPLAVRVYNAPNVATDQNGAAFELAASILVDAGVTPRWTVCGLASTHRGTDPCASPLATSEVAVRIVRVSTPRNQVGELPLGYAVVDETTKAGSLATVYWDRVLWLAEAADVALSTVLGRAVAHEIGHLLLGTNQHSPRGVMRAVWSDQELSLRPSSDWLFMPRDAARIRGALQGRQGSLERVAAGARAAMPGP